VVFAAFLVAAVVAAGVLGLLDPGRLLEPASAVRWLAALALAAPAALAVYLFELMIASRRRRPGLAIGMLMRDAGESVAALSGRPAGWWAIAVITAFAEEILFRGVLLGTVGAEYGVIAGVAVCAVVFGLHHIAFGAAAVAGMSVGGAAWAGLAVLGGGIAAAAASHLCFQALVWRRQQRVTR
jgi:membrane protease YdiL (CAAX protease family)